MARATFIESINSFNAGVNNAMASTKQFAQYVSTMATNVSASAATMTKKFTSGITEIVEATKEAAPMGIEILKGCVEGARKTQEINKTLEQTIKNTGSAAGFTAQEITGMAEQLAKTSTFGADAIKTGQNILLTFTNIGKDVMPEATQAMLDLSQKMGMTLPETASKVGRALDDPIAGMAMLKEVGIGLGEQQKQQIESFTKSGQVMQAQKVIVAELNKSFGGEASAAAETYDGRMKQLGNIIESVKNRIGIELLPYVQKATEAFGFMKEIVSNATSAFNTINEVTSKLKGPFIFLAIGFAALTGAYMTNLGGFKTWVDGIATKATIGFAAVSTALKDLTAKGKLGEDSIKQLTNAFGSGIASKIVTTISAVTSFAKVLKEFAYTGKVSEDSAKQLANAFGNEMGRKIIVALNGIVSAAKIFKAVINGDFKSSDEAIKQFSGNGNMRMADFLTKFKNIITGIKAIVQGFVGLVKGNFSGFKSTLENGFGMSGNSANKFVTVLSGVRGIIISIMHGIGTAVVAVFKFITTHGTLIKATLSGVLGGFIALKAASGVIAVINGVKNGIAALRVTFMALRATFMLLKLAMAANPFTILVIAIGAAIGIFLYFWNTNEKFRNAIKEIWSNIKSAFTNGVQGVKDAIQFIADLPSKFRIWGSDMIDGLVNGIIGGYHKVTDAAKGLANGIKSLLHFSRPDVGPLAEYETWMPDFMSGLAGGISKNKGLVLDATKDVALGINGKLNLKDSANKQMKNGNNAIYNKQNNSSSNNTVTIHIPKLADMLTVREEADIDKISNALVSKLQTAGLNMA